MFSRFMMPWPILLLLALPLDAAVKDTDADGLTDDFEQKILETFVPRFFVSAGDCDEAPAQFRPGTAVPHAIGRDGTIYGQVSPFLHPSKSGVYVEIHYYHLWTRDCGFNDHDLDAEHVSVLITADKAETPAAAWQEKYWYAAAHEDTVCDTSHGSQSSFLKEGHGKPAVWISKGKHASFLNRELCGRGCGADDCRDMRLLIVPQIINLGETSAPANGALWIQAPGWPLAAKMQTDFSAAVLAKLDSQETTAAVPINQSKPPVQKALHVSRSTAGALIAVDGSNSHALSVAADAMETSVKASTDHTGNSLGRAGRAVWNALDASTNHTGSFLGSAGRTVRKALFRK